MLTKWNGERIKAEIRAASILAIDETTEAAADEAEREHWWESRRGRNLERQTINEGARVDARGVSGRFGSTRIQGFYGLFLELQDPWIRPVADRVFPTLQARLRAHYGQDLLL